MITISEGRKYWYEDLNNLASSDLKIVADGEAELDYIFTYINPTNKEINLTVEISENATANIYGAVVAHGSNDVNLNIITHHRGAGGSSRVLVKAVVLDGSNFNFKGMIKIDPEAQGTNAYLENRVLLLDRQCTATSEPSLEIEANDVKASHGASVSSLDESQIFYLLSRGISRAEALKIMVEGFVTGIAERIKDDKVKTAFINEVTSCLTKVNYEKY